MEVLMKCTQVVVGVEGARELREVLNVIERGIKEDRFRLLLKTTMKMRVDHI
jgi:hypothetical protein